MKFNLNSPFFQFVNTLCGYIILNLIFLISCIPIITIGAAVTALYRVTMQEARQEHGYLIQTYFTGMKENIRTSTPIFLFYLIFALILLFNMSFWATFGGIVGIVLLLVVTVVFLMLLTSALYLFPFLARFQNSAKQSIINACSMAIIHRKTTILLLLFHFTAVILFIFIVFAKVFMVILGFAFLALCCSYLLVDIFKKYEPEMRNNERM